MRTLSSLLSDFSQAASPLRMLLVDALHFLPLCLRSPTALAAENLFLRKQLALYQAGAAGEAAACDERHPHRPHLARPLVRLAPGVSRRAARDVAPLASPGIPRVLAVEVAAGRVPGRCG